MATEPAPLIGLFEQESDARSAAQDFISRGLSSYSIGYLDVKSLLEPPPPRHSAAFFMAAFFGALFAAVVAMAAQVFPAVTRYFRADWHSAAEASAVFGAAAGGIIGLILASFLNDARRAPAYHVSFAQGDWPRGVLLAVSTPPDQLRRGEEVMKRSGAVNLVGLIDRTPSSPDVRSPARSMPPADVVEYHPPASPAASAPSLPPDPVSRPALGRRSTDRLADRRAAAIDRREHRTDHPTRR
ncbi:MAG TPA: hypothetical protein VMU17_07490 [Elusimicrobiota bacterium]|nr:hypothetical protein [Elusimicrobiota bacterium]